MLETMRKSPLTIYIVEYKLTLGAYRLAQTPHPA